MSDQAVGHAPRNRLDLWLLTLAAENLYLLNASNKGFMDPDEARCVLFVREMLTKGDCLIPHTGRLGRGPRRLRPA